MTLLMPNRRIARFIKTLEWRDEANLFFRLSRYQEAIEKLIAMMKTFVQPVDAKKLRTSSLTDSVIFPSLAAMSWGLPVPGRRSYVLRLV